MSSDDSLLHPRRRFPFPGLLAPVIFLLLTLLLFNDALFDTTKVIAAKGTDLSLQFLPWRKFGFDELRHGNLALWNPHIYGGAPYFAGFQSALLYPPNWLHLVMPVGLAIDWINALHVFLAGMLTYAWCRYRGVSIGGGVLAGVMFMFCGPYFPHIYAGHLPHIAIMVWAPLLFMSIDMVMDGFFARGTLIGVFAMTMFLLAGHPQYVYYTGMAAAVYVIINLFRAKKIPLAVAGCALIVIGGVAIAAVQLMAGMDFVSESVRSGGTKYQFSASFSFPPENLLTLISPNALGPMVGPEGAGPPDVYFGRNYAWEMSLFVSVAGLILALYGAIVTPFKHRRGAAIMVLVCFILALGAHTPLHHILYRFLPGFASFRGSTKFNYLVALFLSLLAALGFDRLLRTRRASIALLSVTIAMLVIVAVLAILIQSSADEAPAGIWSHVLRSVWEAGQDAGETFSPLKWLGDPALLKQAGLTTAHALAMGAGVIFIMLVILLLTWIRPAFAYLVIALAMVEMVLFAASTRQTMDARPELPSQWGGALAAMPKDSRALDTSGMRNNLGMWFGYDDAWGYDPGVLKRYAELVAFSQGMNPDDASQYVQFHRPDKNIFQLLRLSTLLTLDPKQPVISMRAPMEVAQLVGATFVMPDRKQLLSAMESDSFDPRHAVLLQAEPSIKPAGVFDAGTVQIIDNARKDGTRPTDEIELIADLKANAILLITNAYSKGWRCDPIGPSPQDKYQILPGDWALQAIPMMAGKHHLLLQYRPTAFVIGKWISIVALLGYIATLVWYFLAHGHARADRADG